MAEMAHLSPPMQTSQTRAPSRARSFYNHFAVLQYEHVVLVTSFGALLIRARIKSPAALARHATSAKKTPALRSFVMHTPLQPLPWGDGEAANLR